ncbi:MAG: ABC transporter ATP-binding protein [Treponema sp.]|jgi:peptide/nickel transport system ATP-binding protein|nr:ABC transporter ATP-binding protein [Treponema sp.]
MLEIKNLTIGIKKGGELLKAVDNVSFTIKEGEILGLAGESGCGKTLTTLSIPNLLPPAAKILSGEIVYNNRQLTTLDEKDLGRIRGREISVIFQEVRSALNPLLKAGDQITETLELSGSRDIKKNKAAALQLLEKLGFDDHEKIFNAYPHQLSGGMCQRVLAAAAAIGRPRLLLADEPSTALDTESQDRILSLLMEMNRDYGTGILIVSHDLSIIQKFCSRYLIMYAGKIVEEGEAQALFSPLHPYTKALVGAIPGRDKRGRELETIPGNVPSIEDRFPGCPFAPRCQKTKDPCRTIFPPATEFNGGRVHCHFPETEAADE